MSERKEFEAWIMKEAERRKYAHMDYLFKHDGDDYATTWVDMAWMGWQARSRSKPSDDLAELLHIAVKGIFHLCGNSYANAWAEKNLRVAARYGAYNGAFTGKIRDLDEAFEQSISDDLIRPRSRTP